MMAMHRSACLLPRILFALILTVSFSMCKKHVIIAPDDIVETEQADLLPITKKINDAFGGYYITLPKHYSETRKTYPVLIFYHGLGQTGNGSTDLSYILDDGIGKVLIEKRFPPNFNVGGKNSSFIVVSPQYSVQPTTYQMVQFMTYIMTTYRGDQKRLYVSGLSLGARLTTLLSGTYAMDFAAIAPMAGVDVSPGMDKRCEEIAENNLPVWAFHNQDDPLASLDDANKFINLIKSFNPSVLPRMTIFNVYGHDAWTTALNPEYRENGKNIYEWMLQYSR
jgi:predicted peptidase